jgi:CheY-like chemotaxis protein
VTRAKSGIFVFAPIGGDVGPRIADLQRRLDPRLGALGQAPHVTLVGSSGMGPIHPDTIRPGTMQTGSVESGNASASDRVEVRPGEKPGNGVRVLIVEDDDDIREAARDALLELGYDAHAEANAERALAAIHQHVPAAVIADVRMPGMSGIEFCKRLTGDWPEVPVLLMTAFGDTRAVSLADYNYLNPSASLDVSLAATAGTGEAFDYPGGYAEWNEGGRYARLRLEGTDAARETATGTSTAPALASGYKVHVPTGRKGDTDRSWLVVGVRHSASAGSLLAGDEGGTGYENAFTLAPADAPPRQVRPTRARSKRRHDHPADTEAIGHHPETRREECRRQRLLHLATLGQRGKDPLRFRRAGSSNRQ